MAISQSKYVDIKSSVEPKTTVSRRNLIGLFMSTNDALPYGEVVIFSNLSSVMEVFGASSDEYRVSEKYFNYISKASTKPQQVSFALWSKESKAARLEATKAASEINTFKAISDGSITISLGGVSSSLTGLDFTTTETLENIAETLQSKIQSSPHGEAWQSATVTMKNGVFTLTGGIVGECEIGYASAATEGTDISVMLKWDEENKPLLKQGRMYETPIVAINRIESLSNNFGSFAFIDDLSTDEVTTLAEWTHNKNVKYMFSYAVNSESYGEIQAVVKGFDGVALTYDAFNNYAYFMPMAIMAATNYEAINGSVNYMYNQFVGENPSVISDSLSDELDVLRVNYYGATQVAGNQVAFYQRGYLQGSIYDMGVFANEIWLKDAIVTSILPMFLNKNKVPASVEGSSLARTILQSVLEEALSNGTILSGKTLSEAQKYSVHEKTGDSDAYRQLEQNGYWVNIGIKQVPVETRVEYYLDYLLIYSKGDSIRKVEGLNIVL